MTPAEAFAVLDIPPGAGWEDVRRAYRALLRVHHPDLAGTTHAGAAALVTQAFAVLRSRHDAGLPLSPSRPVQGGGSPDGPARTADAGTVRAPSPGASAAVFGSDRGAVGPIHLLADDTIAVDASAEETFLLLLEAASDAGEVTYVDPDIGLLEAIVTFPGTAASSLVLTLQGRADRVEAFCTLEALDGSPPPPIAAVVEVLVAHVRRRIGLPPPRLVHAPHAWLTDAG